MRFLLLNTASVSSAKKVSFFEKASVAKAYRSKVFLAKSLILGRQDALFLTQSTDLDLLAEPKVITASLASGDWSSHLLVAMGKKINVIKLTNENPFTVVAFFKIKDYALRELANKESAERIETVLLSQINNAFDAGMKDCDELGHVATPRKFDFGVFFSYGSSDDVVIVCGTNSLCLASYALSHIRAISCLGLGFQPEESKFDHFMWDSNCLVAVNLTPDRPEFQRDMQHVIGQIVDKEHTFAAISLASRPGHSPSAIEQVAQKNGISHVTSDDFCSAFKCYGVHEKKLLGIDQALIILAGLIEGGESVARRCRHIRQTCTEVCVERPMRKISKTGQASRVRESVKYTEYLRHLCKKVYAEKKTIDTLESSFSRIFAVASEDAARAAYAYPEAACYSALIDLHRVFSRQHRNGNFLKLDVNEQILQWVDLMDSCYRDRYRGFGAGGAIANLPILSHQGAFGRTLVVCDFLANTFLWLQSRVLSKLPYLDVIDHHSVIVSRFSPAEAASIHATNMGTFFLNIGWRTVFAPDAVYYLCHESANVLITGYFGAPGGDDAPIIFDVLADWVALNTVASPTNDTVSLYFSSLNRLGAIPDGSQPSCAERLTQLTRMALRFHVLSELVAQKSKGKVAFRKALGCARLKMFPEDSIGEFLHATSLPSLCPININILKYADPKGIASGKLFKQVYPSYDMYPHKEGGLAQARKEFWQKIENIASGATEIRAERSRWEKCDEKSAEKRAAGSLDIVCKHVESGGNTLLSDEQKKQMLILMGLRSQIVEPEEFFVWMGKNREDIVKLSCKFNAEED